jgi:hypothetical protein
MARSGRTREQIQAKGDDAWQRRLLALDRARKASLAARRAKAESKKLVQDAPATELVTQA